MSIEKEIKRSIEIDNKTFTIFKINDENIYEYETLPINKVLTDKFDNIYVLIPNGEILKIVGEIKNELMTKNITNYKLTELRKNKYAGVPYYYYNLIINEKNEIMNNIRSFTHLVNSTDSKGIYQIEYNDGFVEIRTPKKYYLSFDIDELKEFNKKIYSYCKYRSIYEKQFIANIINIKQTKFTNNEGDEITYFGFSIKD